MQNFVIETVIAALLVFLLWSMERGRSDRRFRFWLIGWVLVLAHFLSLLWSPSSSFGLVLRQAHLASLEILAATCFILSDPAIVAQSSRLKQTAALATIPSLFAVWVLVFHHSWMWTLYPVVAIGHSMAIVMVRKYLRQWRSRFFSLAALYFLSASLMLGGLAGHKPYLVLACIPAELFLANAILFSHKYSLRNHGNVLAVAGFILWAWSSFFSIQLRHLVASDALFPKALNLPQFLVAIGMTVIILQQDAATSSELLLEYQLLFDNSPVPLWIYDLSTLRFLSANPASARVHGYTLEELYEKKLTDLVHPHTLQSQVVGNKDSPAARHNAVHLRKDGSTVPVSVTAYDIQFQGRPARMALAEDVSERERLAGQLMYQVQHDMLTGLPNRTTFLARLDDIFVSACCDGVGCAVIALQINRFEKINEKFGHEVGDGVLKETTRLLQDALLPQDAIGRTGSREFMVALASVADAAAAEERARALLASFDEPLLVAGIAIPVSISAGLAVYPEDCDDVAALLRDSARAQGRERAPGGERLVRLSRTLSKEAEERERIEGLLQSAVERGSFEVFYQPIANTSGDLCVLEALLRLRDEDGSLVAPGTFIPIAEATGTIISIGRWVVSEVVHHLKDWQDAGIRVVPVAINVSALQIVQASFAAEITAILRQAELDPALIHLELTESGVMPQGSLALDNMMQLSELGIQFSIDDFGTGFSSLDRLHQLPVSTLKIDKTFVSRMLDVNGTMPIVSTVISMAHSLDVTVVAEGVETVEQFYALYEMGCDHFQGYFFSRPMPLAEATKVLSAQPGVLPWARVAAPRETMEPVPVRMGGRDPGSEMC